MDPFVLGQLYQVRGFDTASGVQLSLYAICSWRHGSELTCITSSSLKAAWKLIPGGAAADVPDASDLA